MNLWLQLHAYVAQVTPCVHYQYMSTENVISGDYPDEPLPTAVARRLRGQLAEHRMTLDDLGRVLGLSKMAASRRVNGETPISLAELEVIDAATPITATYLLTGHHPPSSPRPPEPPHPVGVPSRGGQLLRLRESAVDEVAEPSELVTVRDEDWSFVELTGDEISPGTAKPVDWSGRRHYPPVTPFCKPLLMAS